MLANVIIIIITWAAWCSCRMDAHTYDSMGERTQRFRPLVRRAKVHRWHWQLLSWGHCIPDILLVLSERPILVPSDTFHGPLRAQVRTSPTRKRITRTYLKAHDSKGMIHLYFINFTTYGSLVNLRLRNLCSVPFSYPLGSNESQAGMLEGLGMPGRPKSCRYPRMVAEAGSPEELWVNFSVPLRMQVPVTWLSGYSCAWGNLPIIFVLGCLRHIIPLSKVVKVGLQPIAQYKKRHHFIILGLGHESCHGASHYGNDSAFLSRVNKILLSSVLTQGWPGAMQGSETLYLSVSLCNCLLDLPGC